MARKVATRRRLLCAAPSYLARRGRPQTPQALLEHSCLGFTGFQSFPAWEMTDRDGRRVRVEVSGPLVSDDAEVLVEAAVQGVGLMMSTDWLVGRELASGRLVPILEDWTLADEGAVYVVMPSVKGQAAKTRAFADWIGKRFSPEPRMAALKTAANPRYPASKFASRASRQRPSASLRSSVSV
ncbi:substrate binding domain-containing protein [Mesorhizobium atlanticum]